MAIVESFSGIRGIYGKEFTDSAAVKYAYSYCSFLRDKLKKRNPVIAVGLDTRPSGLKLKNIIMGILDCNFIDVGIAPTPAIEFAVRHFNADGGIIITASHNEPEWNGFKFLSSDGSILKENEMNLVINKYKTFNNFHKIQERKIHEKNEDTIEKYSEFILKIIGRGNIEKIKKSKQKIVIDPNGGTGAIAKKILEKAGAEVAAVNMECAKFKRLIEPNEDSLKYLKNVIDESNADFAAGFDCDADRVEILLNDGRLLSGNYILALIVYEMLSRSDNPQKQVVVVNDATSNVVRDIAEKFGAKIKEVEVGEINVVEQMNKSKAIVGGEGSNGGVIIPPSKCRDGILTLLMVLSIVAENQKSLHEIIQEFPQYYTLKKKMEFTSSKHDSIKKSIKNYYSGKCFEIKETGGLKGGLKVITGKNSFVWFRASKTESNVFRMICDSQKKEESKALMQEAVDVFNDANK